MKVEDAICLISGNRNEPHPRSGKQQPKPSEARGGAREDSPGRVVTLGRDTEDRIWLLLHIAQYCPNRGSARFHIPGALADDVS